METHPPPLDFKQRKGGLIVFGVLTVLLGCLCALLAPLALFAQAVAAKGGGSQGGPALMRVAGMYGMVGVALIWLGLGSIMVRRWARSLLVIFSWSWLMIGVGSMCAVALLFPRMMDTARTAALHGHVGRTAQAQEEAQWMGMLLMLAMMGVLFVMFPFGWALFYGSKNVKATCEACDPKLRWTDRCPLPVLAASLWLAACVPSMLITVFARHGVIAFFGTFVSGSLGTVAYILLAMIWGYCAWAFYQLEWRGWYLLVTALVLLSVSSAITYSRHDISELFTLMGYPHEQVARMREFAFFKGSTAAWVAPSAVAPILCYLIYLRRYFPFRAEGR